MSFLSEIDAAKSALSTVLGATVIADEPVKQVDGEITGGAPVDGPVATLPAPLVPGEPVEVPAPVPASSDVSGSDVETPSTEGGATSDAPATDDAAPAKKGRSNTVAFAGSKVQAPEPAGPTVMTWPVVRTDDELYVPDEEFDATDLASINRELNRARARLFRCSSTLKIMQRTLAEAQLNYDRAYRRALIQVSGGNAEMRKAAAEVQCEHLEVRVAVGRQVVEEWRKKASDLRDDLKTLENISHNVRASMNL